MLNTTVLTDATRQWSSRAPDERFSSLVSLHSKAVDDHRAAAATAIDNRRLAVTDDNGDVHLVGTTGRQAKLTNWSFGQLCKLAEAPASYDAMDYRARSVPLD